MSDMARVFIGCDPTSLVPAQVLAYTVRKHARQPVRLVPMSSFPVPEPRKPENRQRTGFSFSRFLIPQLCLHQGRAIYLDSDMLVFGDIGELWSRPLAGKSLACTRQDVAPEGFANHPGFHVGPHFAVMILDCERLRWNLQTLVDGLDEGRYSYEDLLMKMCIVPEGELDTSIPPEWNHLERHVPGETRLTHFTVGEFQPWKHRDNALRGLWLDWYAEAFAAGAVDPVAVIDGVLAGHYLPDLADVLPPELSRLLERAQQRTSAA